MKRILTGVLLLVCALAAGAQTTQITASHISYFGGTTVTGTFCLTPTNQAGQPINIVTPLGQQISPQVPLCFPITSGVLSNSAIVPDTSLTQPANACYNLVINNYYGAQVGVFPCIQPSGATWSFDAYVPSSMPAIPALTLPQFKTNGTLNTSQTTLNLVCSGCNESPAGTINIPSSGGSSSAPYVAGAGSVNVLTATFSPAITSLTAGLEVKVLPNLANTTTTPTLNANGLGAATITKLGTAALAAGDLSTTAVADFIYDGTHWQLQNPQTATGGSLPSIANNTVLGNNSGSTGAAAALTQSALRALLAGPYSFFTVGTGGVTANKIVSFDSSGNAIASAGTGFGGLAAATVSSGGTVEIIRNGVGTCIFDGAAVIGDIAIPSTTTLGDCHDSGVTSSQSIPTTTSVVGAIETAASGSGVTGTIRLHGPGSFGAQIGGTTGVSMLNLSPTSISGLASITTTTNPILTAGKSVVEVTDASTCGDVSTGGGSLFELLQCNTVTAGACTGWSIVSCGASTIHSTIAHTSNCSLLTGSTVTSTACTMTGVHAGDVILVTYAGNVTATAPSSITDSGGGTPVLVNCRGSITTYVNICTYSIANAAAGSHTITANVTSQSFPYLMVDSFSGVSSVTPVDSYAQTGGGGSTSLTQTGPSITPTSTGEMFYGFLWNSAGLTYSTISGSGTFVPGTYLSAPNSTFGTYYTAGTTTSPQAVTATVSAATSTSWAISTAVLH